MKYEQFLKIYQEGPEAVYKLFMEIIETNAKRTALLEERIKELEARLNKNSRNSNKPPSTDEFVKPKSSRKKSGKATGGQKGHKGHTLKMTDEPDQTVKHSVATCRGCGHSLEEVPPHEVERRQVFDLPPLKIIATEHQVESKVCPDCGLENKASFPERVDLPVQYGNNLKGLLIYLNQYQMIPYERLVELVQDVFGHPISEGTLFNANRAAYEALASAEEEVIKQLINSSVIHVDETGMRVEGKRQWLHVTSTEALTHYAYHAKRGAEATADIGILPEYKGVSVHDFWKPYLKYDCDHALCNVHHVRELTGIIEQTGQQWPQEMLDLLLEIKTVVDERRAAATELNPEEIKSFEHRYDQIIAKGYAENPPPPADSVKKTRGRKKQSKAKNLLDRLAEHQRETLSFMHNFNVPFDNNQAERDLRMMKVKQKISGVFRSDQGAKIFCRIRGYISTAGKNSIPVLEAVRIALEGSPFVPKL